MRLFWKLTLLLTLFFAACIGLIRAQPYDDSELRAFLTPPDGCPMPCFMGIRPGVTTMEEAIAILEAHEWVGEVNPPYSGIETTIIDWTWSGNKPDFVNESKVGSIEVVNGVVFTISIPTIISLGEIEAAYGTSGRVYSASVMGLLGSAEYVNFVIVYPQQQISLTGEIAITCAYLATFWNSDVVITLHNVNNYFSSQASPETRITSLDLLLNIKHEAC